MSRRILVTGAGGKTGRCVIESLAKRQLAVRALVRETAPLPAGVEPFHGDMTDPEMWPRALDGVDAVYHICPNMHPAEAEIGQALIAAARAAGVAHFVFHSVLHPQTQGMPHHWQKLRVEELLLMSGVPFTILRPAPYVQNLASQWAAVVARGRLAFPYPPETALSLVDLADVGAAAAMVLTEDTHFGATYDIVGTPPLSQHEVAALLATVVNRPVTARQMPLAEWRVAAVAAGIAGYALETLMQMFDYYTNYGLPGNPNTLRWLLGREPTSVPEVARRWQMTTV